MILANAKTAAEIGWRLYHIDADFDAANLDELLATLAPRRIRYARRWQEAEEIRLLSSFLVHRMRQPTMGNCLRLALVRYEQLRKRGFNVVFHLGVKPSSDGVTGHAWLTLNDEPLWEDAATLQGFRQTYRFPRLVEMSVENERKAA